MCTLVRDYRVEARTATGWERLAGVTANRRRRTVHRLPEPVEAVALRVVVESTNGAPAAHLIAVRGYAPEPSD